VNIYGVCGIVTDSRNNSPTLSNRAVSRESIKEEVDTAVFDIKTKTDYLPSATAGAAGGVFIAGTNAATSIVSSAGHALTLQSTGANGHGLLVQGHGSGSGLAASGGSTGNGIYAVGDDSGMGILAVGGDAALALTAGIFVKSNASSNPVGLYVEDGAIITDDAGTALLVSSTGGNGDGVTLVGNGSGGDLVADITGNLSGSVGSVTAEVSANVTKISSDATAADNAELFFDGTGYAGGTAKLQVEIVKVAGETLTGSGTALDPWGPV
jgi:hypothetical protein